LEGFTKYAAEMDSGAIIYVYIPSFINIGSGTQKRIRRIHRHADRIEIT
jgi:hypothetical protein